MNRNPNLNFLPARPWLAAATMGLLGLTGPADATPDPLAAAVMRSPGIVAARQQVTAAREMAAAAGLFPDPRLEGMAEQGSNGSGANWPKWSGKLEQPLPKAGERAAERLQAQAALTMAEAEMQVMAGAMAAESGMLLVEARALSRKAALMDSQAVRMEKVIAALDSQSAAGKGKLEDRLAVQSRIAELRMRVAGEAQMAEDARLQVRAMLGLEGDSKLPMPGVPTPGPADWTGSPPARLAKAKESEAVAMAAMARAGARPMTAVAITASREEMPMETEDMVGISFMMEIPWRARRAAVAGEKAATARAAAARAEWASARHRFDSARARATRAAEAATTTRRLAESSLGRLDAEYENLLKRTAATTGMDGGPPDILMLLEILEKRIDTEIGAIEAEARADAAAASLWEHTWLSLPNPSHSPRNPKSP